MRVGILGGSFDPPHVGHLLAAQDAVAALSLDHLVVIPAAQQPLKRQQYASADHRLAMAEQTFAHVPQTTVDPIEIERGGLSFMVDTVETLRRRWPLAELHLLIGEDAFASFSAWREPERLRSMARVVVVRRPGAATAGAEIAEQRDEPGFPVQHLASRLVDVSSTEIRERVRAGRSIRGFVTDAVADYIASTGLYLRDPEAADVAARA
jgi:nicotinate-nucleotide adenylyltransferase